ncbi:MAG: aminodeoxychorismate/anthranilate synthase component II [Methanomassiliicoccales archaeon]|nr:aminodeoxychorismate/anthranilate synthase component II [Methanomassiliicoccales archaeon]
MKILLIDNYDSFTYNLYQQLGELGADVEVFRNDAIDLEGVRKMDPDALVLSPGPGHPAVPRDFGVCRGLLLELSPVVPTLGVCLGHQGIAHRFGARVVRAERIVHGKASMIHHDGSALFEGLEDPIEVGRYHSLIVDPDSVPSCLKVTARTSAGEIMGLRHTSFPIVGVQFHPESVLTPSGNAMMANFLRGVRR